MARSVAGIGLRIRLGGGKDGQGRHLPAASGYPEPVAGLGAGPALLSLGAPTSCAWDLPLLREAFGGDLGKLHGLLVPGKES